jgi:hypothetical protein
LPPVITLIVVENSSLSPSVIRVWTQSSGFDNGL